VSVALDLREQLTGWWSPDHTADVDDLNEYQAGAAAGEQAGRAVALDLTLATADVRGLVADLSSPMTATGTVAIDSLASGPVEVTGGVVQLVASDDTTDPRVQHMRYHLPLPSAGLHVEGFKVLDQGDVPQLWPASTTLYVSVHKGDAAGPLLGRGVVHISPSGFAHQVASIRVHGGAGELDRLHWLARFGVGFFGALWDDYGTVIHRSTRFKRNAPPRPHRPLDLPARQQMSYRTADGCDLRLTRYQGGTRGPVVLVHGMGANPLTYMTDTVDQNVTEYLVANGFDVWLQEWRGSTMLPTSHSQFNADTVAQHDHPAAEAAVRSATGRDDIHWITHCVGSMTWMMATLAGTVTPASLVLSSVGAHPIAPRLSRFKARLRAPGLLRRLGVGLLTTDSYDDESWGARLFDQVLRVYPIPREERCDAAVCRRLAFIYGIAVHHAAVNEATHLALHELFGTTDLTMMRHLARCALEERLVTADGRDAYLPNVERARLPITLLHGEHNKVWLPASTVRTHDWLVRELGPAGFEHKSFAGHGHQDTFMGAEAARDAYPAILAHLDLAGA
jgi:cholesterol oxidase